MSPAPAPTAGPGRDRRLGRVLWVTSEPPDHERGGGAIRQAYLLDGLVAVAERVDLLVAGRLQDGALAETLGRVTQLEVPAPRPPGSVTARRARDLWRVGVARLPAEVADRREERRLLRAALGRLAGTSGGPSGGSRDGRRDRPYDTGPDHAPYDFVHVEHLGLAGIVPPGLGRVHSLGVQNVPSAMAEQAGRLAPGRRQRLLLAGEAAAARRFQRRALRHFDAVAVVSEDDGRALGCGGPAGGPRVLVTPNGVDTERLVAAPLPEDGPIVFTGTLDYLPNVDGIVWFAREVLPLVRRAVPDATLSIVGRRPVLDVRLLGELPGVTLHADVPDVAQHLGVARVAVVPVRIGTGSRLKALEAMACARPVAATTIGLEGLEVRAGTDALIGDAPAELAAAVVRLLTDRAAAARVAAAGRSLVESRYRWQDIAARFADGLSRVAAQVAPGAPPRGRGVASE